MKRDKQSHLALTASILVLAGVVGWILQPKPDPAFKGRSLRSWLHGYNWMRESPKIDEAVVSIGTNALPILLRELQAQDSPIWVNVVTFVEKRRIVAVHYVPAETRNMQAVLGFRALGALAKPAVPQLIKLYKQVPARGPWGPGGALRVIGPSAKGAVPVLLPNLLSTNAGAREIAAATIGDIHSDPQLVVPVLITALNDPASPVRYAAVTALGCYGPAANDAVPSLIELLKSPRPGEPNAHIIYALGEIHSQPGFVVPMLMELLSRPDRTLLTTTLGALEKFGAAAEPAFPKLVQMRRDEDDASTAEAIARALKAINPKAAAELDSK